MQMLFQLFLRTAFLTRDALLWMLRLLRAFVRLFRLWLSLPPFVSWIGVRVATSGASEPTVWMWPQATEPSFSFASSASSASSAPPSSSLSSTFSKKDHKTKGSGGTTMSSSRYLRSTDTSTEGALRAKLREEGGETLPLEQIDQAPKGIEEGELPESYSQDRLILLARSPYELFCYWDFASLQAIPAEDLFLQIYENEHLIASQPVAAYPRRRCYIRLSRTGGVYRAVLIHSVLGKAIQRSNPIAPILPPRMVSQAPRWASLDPERSLESQFPLPSTASTFSAQEAPSLEAPSLRAEGYAPSSVLYAPPGTSDTFTPPPSDEPQALPRVQFLAPTEVEDLDITAILDELASGSGVGLLRPPSSEIHAKRPSTPKGRPA